MQNIRTDISSKKESEDNGVIWLIKFFIILTIFWSCSANQESPQQKDEVSYPWKLICIGDGITAGIGLDGNTSYPALLEKMLRESTMPRAKVVNAGIKGETISGVNQRIEWMLQQRFSAILLAMNTNDLTEDSKQSWNQCLQKIRYSNPEALILVGSIKGAKLLSDVRDYFGSFAEQYEVEVIDLQLDTPGKNIWWQDDKPYLTPEGQMELANRIFGKCLDAKY